MVIMIMLTSKANQILGIILFSLQIIKCLLPTMVRPVIEYGNSAWGPYYISDQQNIEKIQ